MNDLADFFYTSGDLLATLDPEGKFICCSRSWRPILEGSPSPVSYLELVHPDDRRLTARQLKRLSSDQSSVVFENRLITPQGSWELSWTARKLIGQADVLLAGRDVSSDPFRSIVENSVDGIFQSTVDGQFIRVNRSMATLYGYSSPAELVGSVNRMDEQIFVDSDRRRQLLDELTRTGRVTDFQSQVYRKDGSIIWISEDIRLVQPADGSAPWLEGVTRDITTAKQSELALAASELRYAMLTESMSEGLLVVDNDDRILHVNSRLCDMAGYSADDLIGKIAMDVFLISEEDRKLLKEKNRNRLQGVSDRYEISIRRKDGGVLWVLLGGAPMYGDAGIVIGSIGVLTDITERRIAERRIRLSDLILQHVSNLVLVGDPMGLIVYVSPSIGQILGYSADEVLGEGWWKLSRSDIDERQASRQAVVELSAGIRRVSSKPYETEVVDRWGRHHWLEWQDAVGPEGLVIGVAHDISDRKGAEQALRISERKFHDLVAYSAGYICTHDLDGVFLTVNPSACARLGYTAEEMQGQPIEKFVWPDRRNLVAEYLEELRARDEASGYIKFSTKNGETAVWSYTNRVLRDAGEEPYVIGYAQDVTEKLALEREKEKWIEELKKTLSEIKILSGMLPICASCKKIKDDQGYWHQIETYISTHSAAQFTHGLCVECQHKLYPELFKPDEPAC